MGAVIQFPVGQRYMKKAEDGIDSFTYQLPVPRVLYFDVHLDRTVEATLWDAALPPDMVDAARQRSAAKHGGDQATRTMLDEITSEMQGGKEEDYGEGESRVYRTVESDAFALDPAQWAGLTVHEATRLDVYLRSRSSDLLASRNTRHQAGDVLTTMRSLALLAAEHPPVVASDHFGSAVRR